MEIERTPLPGIGLRHTFQTESGKRIGVLTRRGGIHDLLIYDEEDPDAALAVVTLNPEEAAELSDLLGAPHYIERLEELSDQFAELVTEKIPLQPNSPYAHRTLGDTQTRTRTGASIVAVLRERDLFASPRPDFLFQPGDIIVVVGTAEGVRSVVTILAEG